MTSRKKVQKHGCHVNEKARVHGARAADGLTGWSEDGRRINYILGVFSKLKLKGTLPSAMNSLINRCSTRKHVFNSQAEV